MDDFNLWELLAGENYELESYVEEYKPPQVSKRHETPNLGCRWDNPFRVSNDSYTTY